MIWNLKREAFEPRPGRCFVKLVGGRITPMYEHVCLDFVELVSGKESLSSLHHRFTLAPSCAVEAAKMVGSLRAFRFGYLDEPFEFNQSEIDAKLGTVYEVFVRETQDGDLATWRWSEIDLEAGVVDVMAAAQRRQEEQAEIDQILDELLDPGESQSS